MASQNEMPLLTRLITKEGLSLTAVRGSLSKCVLRYRDFIQEATSTTSAPTPDDTTPDTTTDTTTPNPDPDPDPNQHQNQTTIKKDLISQLQLHNIEMRKLAFSTQATTSDLQHYDTLTQETTESINQTRNEIHQLKKILDHEQKVRKNRYEYEALAKMASVRPSSFATKRKLEVVYKEIEEIEVKKKKAEFELDVRRKQFQGLIQNIFDLKNSLEEDSLRSEIEDRVKEDGDGGGSELTKDNANDDNDDGDDNDENDVDNLYECTF
mmetsp:Transcript_28371/g.35093  ORF Transcript_28371/g.35093 Transcript_28371/m.35093 type:complete len:267 (-) Transcript_28371:605-1405(-)